MSTEADCDPPDPLQVILKLLLPAIEIVTSSEPEVSFEEVHKAEHEVALVDDQLRVDELFNSTDIGFAEKFIVGTNGDTGEVGLSPLPPPPQEEITVIEITGKNKFLKKLFTLLLLKTLFDMSIK